jgi:CRISPR/Cas system CSM-associated protein Csm3 (group 7 of RAMP superfamily)
MEMDTDAQWNNSRQVVERIYITGQLELITPTHFGNGDAERLTDIPLQRDPLDGETPLLTGASISGALRNELREREYGFHWSENPESDKKSLAEQLFGHLDDQAKRPGTAITTRASVESWLMVDDALGKPPLEGGHIELRDGVTIDARTRTARMVGEGDRQAGQKYDLELLAAGTTFNLSFELWLTADNQHLLAALAAALLAFENGAIHLGSRKQRGLGECKVANWSVWRYKANDSKDLMRWIRHDSRTGGKPGNSILDLLDVDKTNLPQDRREAFNIDGWFNLDGSLLIRSEGMDRDGPDTIHLRSLRDGELTPVITGTSLAGVIRGRALRIAQTIHPETGWVLLDHLFGRDVHRSSEMPGAETDPSGSRVRIHETVLKGGIIDRVQSRVKIDRFTGGSFPQALFTEQAVWGDAGVHLILSVARAFDEPNVDFKAKVGLLLLVLKDLWIEDLPIGGEIGVGRGRLIGQHAALTYKGQNWILMALQPSELDLQGDKPDFLQECVDALWAWQPAQEVKNV